MNDIKVWAQMFFDDGSVSQGIRIPVETLDDDRLIEETGQTLLDGLNREEGLLLIWGAGSIGAWEITSSKSSQPESETLESSPE